MQARPPEINLPISSLSVENSVSIVKLAIETRNVAFIRDFLAAGGNIGVYNTLLHTVIETYAKALRQVTAGQHAAIREEGEEIVYLLVRAGVQIDSINADGQTALHVAAEQACVLEEFLIQLGADLNHVDFDGAFILEKIIPDTQRMEKYIIAGANVKKTNQFKETILHRLIMYSIENSLHYLFYIHMFRVFILYGADINAPDKDGRTPLHLAVRNSCIDVVRALFSLNIAPIFDSAQYRGETPAEINPGFGELESELINICATVDIDHQDYLGRTALMDSASEKIAALLIVFGANVTLADKSGRTALSDALMMRHDATAALLRRVEDSPRVSAVHGSLFHSPGNADSPQLSWEIDDAGVTPRPL